MATPKDLCASPKTQLDEEAEVYDTYMTPSAAALLWPASINADAQLPNDGRSQAKPA